MSPQLKKASLSQYLVPMGLSLAAASAWAVTAGINFETHFSMATSGTGQYLSAVSGLFIDSMVILLAAAAGAFIARNRGVLGGALLALAAVFGVYCLSSIIEWGGREYIEKAQLAEKKQAARLSTVNRAIDAQIAQRGQILDWAKGTATVSAAPTTRQQATVLQNTRQQTLDAVVGIVNAPIKIEGDAGTAITHASADPGAATISSAIKKVGVSIAAEDVRIVKMVLLGVLLIFGKIIAASAATALWPRHEVSAAASAVEDRVAANDTEPEKVPDVIRATQAASLKLVESRASDRDHVQRFFDACRANPGLRGVRADTVYGWYHEWIRATGGPDSKPVTLTMFGRILGELGVQRAKEGSFICYRGLGRPTALLQAA